MDFIMTFSYIYIIMYFDHIYLLFPSLLFTLMTFSYPPFSILLVSFFPNSPPSISMSFFLNLDSTYGGNVTFFVLSLAYFA
jgi:hypothetical protein